MISSKRHTQWMVGAALCLGLLGGCGGGDKAEPEASNTTPTTDVPAELSGTWMSAGDVPVDTVWLLQDGERVTGNVDNEYGTQPITGTVFGYDLAFSFVQLQDGCEVNVSCFATLFEEQMRGSCKLVTQCAGNPLSTRNGRITLTRK